MNEPTNEPPCSNCFDALMREFDKSRLLAEINEAYNKLVLAVRQVGKKGSIALKVSVEPSDGGDARTVNVSFDVDQKLPKPKRRVLTYFTTEDGRTVKNDPEQREMVFQSLPKAEEIHPASIASIAAS